MNLKQEFHRIVEKYLNKLLNETDYYLDYWIADEIGGVACISNEIFMTFDDIRYCVNNHIPVERYSDYQDEMLEEHFKLPRKEQYRDYVKEKYLNSSFVNFQNWLKMNKEQSK